MKRNKIRILVVLVLTTILTLSGCSNESSKDLYKDNPNKDVQVFNKVEVEEEKKEYEKVNYENIDKIVESGYEDVEAYLDSQWEQKDFQGVALVAEGDEIKFIKAYGYSDINNGIENKITTRFAIASNTKQFTAVAILQLVEEGKISLDDTIDKFFPEYKYGEKITVKNLLQMRTGIVDYLNYIDSFMKNEEAKEILSSYKNDIYYDRYVEDPRWNSEIILQNLYLNDLLFEPGTEFAYSNSNYYLLGLIIEKASGMSYEAYVKENLFDICNMNNTNMQGQNEDAKGHGSYDSGEIVVNPNFTFAAGNIYSNVIDLFKWNRMLHGGELLSDKMYREMTTPVNRYGYGLIIEDEIIKHGGTIDGFKANSQYDRENDRTIIILENKDNTTGVIDAKFDTDKIDLLIK